MHENMGYIENPKTKGSGIICAIPQAGICPIGCKDCFFQSGRSYLVPFDKNLPNMPTVEQARGHVVRVNDGNDSNNHRNLVMKAASIYEQKFYNTSIARDLDKFDAPVVLTVNPNEMTDSEANLLDQIPNNLMFVRVRTNTWNFDLVDSVVKHYTKCDLPPKEQEGVLKIPVVLTFMRYYLQEVPEADKKNYIYKKEILNDYWMINTAGWEGIMARYKNNKFVSSCGKIEGEHGAFECRYCGVCLREYFATRERLSASTSAK